MSITEFQKPDFLEGVTADSITQNMLSNLPLDIDKTEGGFIWDLLRPAALEKAELLQFQLVRTLQIMHPMWADGRWLDLHAQENGLERKPANAAYGVVTVAGKAGIKIPLGFVFSVPSDNGVAAVDFATLTAAVIGPEGVVDIEVQAVEPGTGSNVDADTITIMRAPIKGITNITNENPTTGGTAEETDDELRARIDYLLSGAGDSFVGNNADYVRWAKEVLGVGYAHTIPEYNGPNSVKVVVCDANGEPANAQILANVYKHIFGENRKDPLRLAPVGVVDFEVVAPLPVDITISFKLKLEAGYTEETVVAAYRKALADYYSVAAAATSAETTEIKFYKMAALLTDTDGVADIDDFLVNGAEENISFTEEEFPVTGDIEVVLYG